MLNLCSPWLPRPLKKTHIASCKEWIYLQHFAETFRPGCRWRTKLAPTEQCMFYLRQENSFPLLHRYFLRTLLQEAWDPFLPSYSAGTGHEGKNSCFCSYSAFLFVKWLPRRQAGQLLSLTNVVFSPGQRGGCSRSATWRTVHHPPPPSYPPSPRLSSTPWTPATEAGLQHTTLQQFMRCNGSKLAQDVVQKSCIGIQKHFAGDEIQIDLTCLSPSYATFLQRWYS
jgi:hypothetical protein